MMVVFAAFGSGLGALAGSMPVVTRNAGIDNIWLGFAMTVSTLATVFAMSLGGPIARHASYRRILLASLPLVAALLLAFLAAQSAWWFFVAFIPLGFVIGLADLFMNAEGAAIEHDLGRPVFTTFHASVSASVAIFAIVSSFVSTLAGAWASGILSCIMFAVAWLLVFLHIAPRQLAPKRTGRSTLGAGRRPLVLLGISAGLIIAAETAALLWSAKLLDGLAPSLAAVAGLGAAFFGICNAMLRFLGDALRARFGDLPIMMGSLAVAIIGFTTLGLSGSFMLSVAAFATVGFGTAVLIPCAFAVAAGFVPGNRVGGLGFVSVLSGFPRILAPWLFGWAASLIGINGAFGLLAIGLGVALVMVTVLRYGR